MGPLLIVASAVGGAAIGGVAGFAAGLREPGDFNFAPVIYAPLGALIGGFAGVVIGATVFGR